MTSSIDNLRVIELKVENFMGIKVIELHHDELLTGENGEHGDLVVVGGRNGQGKTSLLNAIECAIRGKSHHPGKPIREGDDRAEINLDLGSLKIRRVFKEGGGSAIRVSNAEGFSPSNPQTLLDTLAGAISFDPLEFSRMDAKKQLDVVRALSGVDTDGVDEDFAKVYKDRTEVNAVIKNMTGEIAAMPRHTGVGMDPISVVSLLQDIEEHRQANRRRQEALDATSLDLEKVQGQTDLIAQQRDDIEQMEEALEKKKIMHEELKVRTGEFSDAALASRAEALEAPEIDISALHTQLAEIETKNELIADNQLALQRTKDRGVQQEKAAELTGKLLKLQKKKQKMIAEANLPLAGLSFDGAGVTLDGIPFAQISGAESLRASVAIGVALNPKLKVMLIRDGSLLDAESMELLSAVAKENDYQIFVERVGNQDEGAIVIEAGEVVK